MSNMELGPVRAISAVDLRLARQSGERDNRTAEARTSEPEVVRSDSLDPGDAPVDTDRVATIRKAVESGNYPILPMRIADAMIAAGVMLRSGK